MKHCFALAIAALFCLIPTQAMAGCGPKIFSKLLRPKARQEVEPSRAPSITSIFKNRSSAELAIANKQLFDAYVNSLQTALVEREWVIELGLLALISQEHLLLMGPPGNAKSMISNLMLGNIVDAEGNPSYFSIQMTPETTISETHGPFDYNELVNNNVYRRLTDEGMLPHKFNFVDEIFDSRANALRNILGLLNERSYSQGSQRIEGEIQTVFAATNHYLSEIYANQGERPRAIVDRFALVAFIPGEMEFIDSNTSLISSTSSEPSINHLPMSYLENLQTLTTTVEIPESVSRLLAVVSSRLRAETENLEQAQVKAFREAKRNGEEPSPPYRTTKYHSPRTLYKAAKMLKAIVVLDWLNKGGDRDLIANAEDVMELGKFFGLNGPNSEFTEAMSERATNEYELVQQTTILEERRMFRENYDLTRREMSEAIAKYSLQDIGTQLEGVLTDDAKLEIKEQLLEILVQVDQVSIAGRRQSEATGEDAGNVLVRNYVFELLQELESSTNIAEIRAQIAAEREERLREVAEAAEREAEQERAKEEQRLAIEAEHRAIEEQNSQIANTYSTNANWSETSISIPVEGSSSTIVYSFDASQGLFLRYVQESGHIFKLNTSAGSRSTFISTQLRDALVGNQLEEMHILDSTTAAIVTNSAIKVIDFNDGKLIRSIPLTSAGETQYHALGRDNWFTVFEQESDSIAIFDWQDGRSEEITLNSEIAGFDALPVKPQPDKPRVKIVHEGRIVFLEQDLSHAFALDPIAKSVEYLGRVMSDPVSPVSPVYRRRFDGKYLLQAHTDAHRFVYYEVSISDIVSARRVANTNNTPLKDPVDLADSGARLTHIAGTNLLLSQLGTNLALVNLDKEGLHNSARVIHPISINSLNGAGNGLNYLDQADRHTFFGIYQGGQVLRILNLDSTGE